MRAAAFLPILAAVAGGCGIAETLGLAPDESGPGAMVRAPTNDEPAHVVLRQVLISFEGAAAGARGATRTQEEAKRLAERVLEEARGGRDFGDLVRLYSDDRTNDGRCALANWGVATGDDELERQRMPRAFGALGFKLAVEQIGLVEYDANASPRGWHVLKRMR